MTDKEPAKPDTEHYARQCNHAKNHYKLECIAGTVIPGAKVANNRVCFA
jgi:hypothetical protein